jgi:hypothetical protein
MHHFPASCINCWQVTGIWEEKQCARTVENRDWNTEFVLPEAHRFFILYFPFYQTGVAHHPAIMACLPSLANMLPDSGYIGLNQRTRRGAQSAW